MTRATVLKAADVALVLALTLSALWQVWSAPTSTLEGGRAVHLVLALAVALPLFARRRHPVAAFLAVFAAGWVQMELGGTLGQPWFAALLTLYAVGAHAAMPLSLTAPAGVALYVVLVDIPRLVDGAPWDSVVPAWFILVGVWGFGRWMRRRRRDTAALTARAESAERQAAQALADERARIARELHDLVAHSMGVIVIQAQGAQRTLDRDPEQARAALSAIETTGRSGLAEMRRLLALLTAPSDGDPDGDPAGGTAPQPSLASLDQLVESVRRAGLPVELTVCGRVRPLSAGLELSGYRVVQEALTNVLKHAKGGSADVRVAYHPDRLEIAVADTGRPDSASAGQGPAAGSAGHGLVGMRERVLLYGGSLEAGPDPAGGFGVRARFPLNGASA